MLAAIAVFVSPRTAPIPTFGANASELDAPDPGQRATTTMPDGDSTDRATNETVVIFRNDDIEPEDATE